METKMEDYTNYKNQELLNQRDNMVQQMYGCNYECKFCKTQCQVGYHNENKKHNCAKYGHGLRANAGGIFQNEKKEQYPSLQICNSIPPNSLIKINDKFHKWSDIQKIR